MIYTVTLNPSLDYVATLEHFQTGTINRTRREAVFPGGKGLNVSRILKNFGKKSIALGFAAGFIGEAIREQMEKTGCRCQFVKVKNGMSRINVKLHAEEETEINGQGPAISREEIGEFYELLKVLKENDYLVLAGSIPPCMSDNMYKEILEQCKDRKIRYVVDAAGDVLINVLPYHPFLIKPNHHELSEIFGKEIKSKENMIFYGKKLQEMGARNVLISRAEDGAILLTDDGTVLESPAPKGNVVNSAGAGDSMVAGFLAGYLETGSYEDAFYFGVAAGSATAFSEDLAGAEDIYKIRENMKIRP